MSAPSAETSARRSGRRHKRKRVAVDEEESDAGSAAAKARTEEGSDGGQETAGESEGEGCKKEPEEAVENGAKLKRCDGRPVRMLDAAVGAFVALAAAYGREPGLDWVSAEDVLDVCVAHMGRLCPGRTTHASSRQVLRRVIFPAASKTTRNNLRAFEVESGDDFTIANWRGYRIRPNEDFWRVREGIVFADGDGMEVGFEELGVKVPNTPSREGDVYRVPIVVERDEGDGEVKDGGEEEIEEEEEVEERVEINSEDSDEPLPENRLPASLVAPCAAVGNHWLSPPPGPVRLSAFDRDPKLTVLPSPPGDPEVVCAFKGFRSIRASHGVFQGCWYFEVTVLPYEGDGAVRLGWSSRRSPIGVPVGFDDNGFGIRDRSGEFFHNSFLTDYASGFEAGDVIGCCLRLPPSLSRKAMARIAEDSVRILNRKHGDWTGPSPLPICDLGYFEGGMVEFYKNGTSLGIPLEFQKANSPARIAVYEYFPTISLFKNAQVRVSFGPFDDLPPGCSPVCELAAEEEFSDVGSEADYAVVGEGKSAGDRCENAATVGSPSSVADADADENPEGEESDGIDRKAPSSTGAPLFDLYRPRSRFLDVSRRSQ